LRALGYPKEARALALLCGLLASLTAPAKSGGTAEKTLRQGTVEPVFGNLLHHYGLRRVNTKGQAAAHKAMLLSAVAYNLKKLLKYRLKRVRSMVLACQPHPYQQVQGAF